MQKNVIPPKVKLAFGQDGLKHSFKLEWEGTLEQLNKNQMKKLKKLRKECETTVYNSIKEGKEKYPKKPVGRPKKVDKDKLSKEAIKEGKELPKKAKKFGKIKL